MTVKKNTLIKNFFFGIIFLICSLLSEIRFFSYLSMLFFFIYFFAFIIKNKEFALKYLAFLFISTTAILGVAIIELGDIIYLVELNSYSSFVGSLPLLIFSYWLFLVIIILVDNKYEARISSESLDELAKYSSFYNMVSIVVLGLFLLLFSRIASQSALQLGVDRFVYATQYSQLGVLDKIVSNAPLLVVFPILTIIYNKGKYQRIIGVLGVCMYILYFAWIGNKFGPFFTLICVFILVYYKRIIIKGKKFLKMLLVASIASFALIVSYSVAFSISTSSYSGLSYLEQRASQQGQLWWKTYEVCKQNHPAEFINEIKAVNNGKEAINDNVGSNNGIYKIMYLSAPKEQVDFKLSTGSRYSEAGFATMYYYFGSMGVVLFSCVMGTIIAMTINCFIINLSNGDFIKSLIFLRFFLLERTSLSMFLFNDFVGIISILSYIYLFIMRRKKFVFKKKDGWTLSIVKYKR